MTERMRTDWDNRARKDAYYYIASWRKDWDDSGFLASGEEDFQRFVAPAFDRFQFSPDGKTMLELGCGAGRMTGSFAGQFASAIGFDVSNEMLALARALHQTAENIKWVQGNGADLSNVRSASIDFVFSYLVLQHLPEEALVHTYLREILRVLKDGGICLFQYNGTSEKFMNWKGRAVWGVADLLWRIRLTGVGRSVAKLLGQDPEMAGRSWHGIGVKAERVVETVRSADGSVLELSGDNTAMAWCCARKNSGLGELGRP
ncbi:MAG: class I SAM-dependent methyltransferase [Candidatus Acidiferrales bacterium]